MFSFRCQRWINERGHGAEDNVSGIFDTIGAIPISHDSPLCGKVGAGFLGQSRGVDSGVNVDKALQVRNPTRGFVRVDE